MKELWQNKAFRALCWQVFNAGVAFLVSSLGGLEWDKQVIVVGLAIPVLNILTKWINSNLFGDIGVKKEEKSDFIPDTQKDGE